ncbi:MAG: metallophosphoesterase family protein [Bacteroidales bacterium]|nr:metallophosphoesterase family protein [Bacteroidales bacterium]
MKAFRSILITLLLAVSVQAAGQAECQVKCQEKGQADEPRVAARLQYNREGRFKIVQLADTHVIAGDPRSERAIQNINAVLDAEKPDFVIHTGDIVFGEPAGPSAQKALQPLADRGIPFAVALGNHDSDFDLTREEIYNLILSFPGNVNTSAEPGINGFSNDILTLSGKDGIERVLYLFDSGSREYPAGIKSWGYVHSDQIDWYRRCSDWFSNLNGGSPVPALAFFHIPFPEYRQALGDASKKARFLTGNLGEEPAVPLFNTGLYTAMREKGDVQGVVTGHDHNNDFVMLWQGFFFIYGRYGGCDTVYNDLKPNGARVFEFTEGDKGFRTWIRFSDGRVEQERYLFPGMKTLSDTPQK